MVKLFSTVYLVLLACVSMAANLRANPAFAYQITNAGHAKIDLKKDTNKITVRSLFLDGEAGQVLNYKLTVEKKGKSGTSSNSQSGKFEVKPGQPEIVLSTSGFSAYPNDQYFIQLQVFQGTELISQDTLVYEPTIEK